MATNAFLRLDGAPGESDQQAHQGWIEVDGWDWEIEARTSWPRGGGASVGRPSPSALTVTHAFDLAAPVELGRISSGTAFARAELHASRATADQVVTYLTVLMENVFLTRVAVIGTADGSVQQQVSLVFKTITIDYHPLDRRTGTLGPASAYTWDIPAGVASPSG